MSLNLDLGESFAKLQRAGLHLDALNREAAAIGDSHPVTLILGEINPETGWLPVYLRLDELKELSLAVIVGDLMHNLRCTLDYIVTALVHASRTKLTNRHQFPIYLNRERFHDKVLSADHIPTSRGPLKGITLGLREIYDLQPFNLDSNPETSALWAVHRFSNADKHRRLTQSFAIPSSATLAVETDGQLVDRWQTPGLNLRLNEKVEIARFRFARPYPTQAKLDLEMEPTLLFGAEAFDRDDPVGLALTLNALRTCLLGVRRALDVFLAL